MDNEQALEQSRENLRCCQSAFDAAEKKVGDLEEQLKLARLERDLLSSQLDEAGTQLRKLWESIHGSQSDQPLQ